MLPHDRPADPRPQQPHDSRTFEGAWVILGQTAMTRTSHRVTIWARPSVSRDGHTLYYVEMYAPDEVRLHDTIRAPTIILPMAQVHHDGITAVITTYPIQMRNAVTVATCPGCATLIRPTADITCNGAQRWHSTCWHDSQCTLAAEMGS